MKQFGNIFDLIRMNGDDDDDFDDDFDELSDDYDDDDDLSESDSKNSSLDDDNIETTTKKKADKKVKKGIFNKTAKEREAVSSRKTTSEEIYDGRSNLVALDNRETSKSRCEVCVMRPTVYEDTQAICDVLHAGKAAVINLEGIDMDTDQRIVDFSCGACYALHGNIEIISNFIFIITPRSIRISGDTNSFISSGLNFSNFDKHF